MRSPADRLASASDEEFAAFAARLAEVWPAWEASVSPVSPEGTVEVSLTRAASGDEPERAVIRLRRGPVTLEAVNDFAVFAAERGLTFAVLATAGDVSERAAARARAAPVEVYDGVGLVSMARDADVTLFASGTSEDGPDGE